MTQTGNYELNQWAETDRIQMEDFNSDNEKIDAALKANADAVALAAAAAANAGNCSIWTTTYTGTGGAGANSPNQLTFPRAPILVLIHGGSDNTWGHYAQKMGLLLNGTHLLVPSSDSVDECAASWSNSGKTVTWFSPNSSVTLQLNANGSVYTVTALLPAN